MSKSMHKQVLNRIEEFGSKHRKEARTFQYIDYRKIVCIAASDPDRNPCEQGFGLAEWILENPQKAPARLRRALTSDLIDQFAWIAKKKKIPFKTAKWKKNRYKVLIRDFGDDHPHDIIITPNRIFVPWPLPVSAPMQKKLTKVLKKIKKQYKIRPKPLRPKHLKDGLYLYYTHQWGPILSEGHTSTPTRTNTDLYRFVSDTRALLQKRVGPDLELPKQMEFVPLGEVWDAELEYMPELKTKGLKPWVMRLRGANALNPYALTLEVPTKWRIQGLRLQDVVAGLEGLTLSGKKAWNGTSALLEVRIPEGWEEKLTLADLFQGQIQELQLAQFSIAGGSQTGKGKSPDLTEAAYCSHLCRDSKADFALENHAVIETERAVRDWNFRTIEEHLPSTPDPEDAYPEPGSE